MARVFGDRLDFAIEAGIEPDLQTGTALWGHMCVWCRGVALAVIWILRRLARAPRGIAVLATCQANES